MPWWPSDSTRFRIWDGLLAVLAMLIVCGIVWLICYEAATLLNLI